MDSASYSKSRLVGEWEHELVRTLNLEASGKGHGFLIPASTAHLQKQRVTELHAVCDPCTHFGIDVWQVNAGTVFDDILVTDSVAEAERARAAFATKIASEVNHLGKRARKEKMHNQQKTDL